MKSTPLSVRLPDYTYRFVEAEAKRTRRSRGSIVAELADEAARGRAFPGIGFRDGPTGRRAWLEVTALDVWQVIAALHSLGSLDRRPLEELRRDYPFIEVLADSA